MGYRRHIVFMDRRPVRSSHAAPVGQAAVGVDFRATVGFVTDPPGYTVNVGTGWTAPPTGARDRSRTVDPRLAGCVFVLNETGVTAIYSVSVQPGPYLLRLALGDATTVQRQNCLLYDGSRPLATVAEDHGTQGGTFLDATGIARTAATWSTSNAARALTLESGTLRLLLGNAVSGLASTTIATLSLTPA